MVIPVSIVVEHFFCDLVYLRILLVHVAQSKEGKGASQYVCRGSYYPNIKVDLSSEIPKGILIQVKEECGLRLIVWSEIFVGLEIKGSCHLTCDVEHVVDWRPYEILLLEVSAVSEGFNL